MSVEHRNRGVVKNFEALLPLRGKWLRRFLSGLLALGVLLLLPFLVLDVSSWRFLGEARWYSMPNEDLAAPDRGRKDYDQFRGRFKEWK